MQHILKFHLQPYSWTKICYKTFAYGHTICLLELIVILSCVYWPNEWMNNFSRGITAVIVQMQTPFISTPMTGDNRTYSLLWATQIRPFTYSLPSLMIWPLPPLLIMAPCFPATLAWIPDPVSSMLLLFTSGALSRASSAHLQPLQNSWEKPSLIPNESRDNPCYFMLLLLLFPHLSTYIYKTYLCGALIIISPHLTLFNSRQKPLPPAPHESPHHLALVPVT